MIILYFIKNFWIIGGYGVLTLLVSNLIFSEIHEEKKDYLFITKCVCAWLFATIIIIKYYNNILF